MLILNRALISVAAFLSLIGCDNKVAKTDSMLYRENAIKQAQAPLLKARDLLSESVVNSPRESLDTLVVAQNALTQAQQIYKKNSISGYDDPELARLQAYFDSLQPELVSYAKSLLIQVVERTMQLRKQIEEAKNQPYSARGNDTTQLVDFLADKYNQDVKSCCLNRLSQIDQILSKSAASHRELLVLIRSINTQLGDVIKQQSYGPKLIAKINRL